MSRTKIVATIGPATRDPKMLQRLVEAGVDVFRLNFSHGDLEEHRRTIEDIRHLTVKGMGLVAILGDLSGPKIRCSQVADGPIYLENGQEFRLIMDDAVVGGKDGVGVNYEPMIEEVEIGHRISMNDGNVVLRAVGKETDAAGGKGALVCEVEQAGEIDSRKGINCPDSSLSADPVTEYDRKCIEFACKMGLDYLALSFVRGPRDVEEAKKAVKANKSDIPVIAKIERHEAIRDIEKIVRVADGIMVARGDLGVEIPLQEVPNAQKKIIRLCNRLGKPVITATQMLETMIYNHRPTRAEVNDVANAIYDGTDAVMLSGETATGRYPVEAVRIMGEIARAAEREAKLDVEVEETELGIHGNISDALSRGACLISKQLGCTAIISKTRFGSTPRLIARLRPPLRIITFTPSRTWARRLKLIWGVIPFHTGSLRRGEEEGADQTKTPDPSVGPMMDELSLALQLELVKPGDRVTLVSGLSLDNPERANMMRVLEI